MKRGLLNPDIPQDHAVAGKGRAIKTMKKMMPDFTKLGIRISLTNDKAGDLLFP